MKALDKKLFRELKQMKSQVLTIALVVTAGVSLFVASNAAYDSLLASRDSFYAKSFFSGGFVSLKKAPISIAERIGSLEGLTAVESRIIQEAVLDLPGEILPASARLVTMPVALNKLHLEQGTGPKTDQEIVINRAFAMANKFHPGNKLSIVLNGKRKNFIIAGIALSPEYVYNFKPGSFLPDDKHYGIVWLTRSAMEENFDFRGAFNNLAFNFAPHSFKQGILKEIDTILEKYGGYGAYDKDKLASNAFLKDEFRQLRSNAIVLPAIFLAVAAFLLHIVAARIVSRQREQIASLKALGYSNRSTAFHYLKLMWVISGSGASAGIFLGFFLGKSMTNLYAEYYHLAGLKFIFNPVLIPTGILSGIIAATIGTLFSVFTVLRLQPAQAMRPPMPESFRTTPIDSLMAHFSVPARMYIRNLFKRPLRTLLSVTGISLSVMIMVLGLFTTDAVDNMLDLQFNILNRESITVSFIKPVNETNLSALRSIPGVLGAEGYRHVPIRIRYGHKQKEATLSGIPENAQLRRLANAKRNIISLPPFGMLLNSTVAAKLNIVAGSEVTLEILEGNRKKVKIRVTALIDEFFGQGAFMRLDRLAQILDQPPTMSLVALFTDSAKEKEILTELKKIPVVSGVSTRATSLKVFYELMAKSTLSILFVIILFASAIAIGVVYNTAMISLSERTFEISNLRILGFTRNEVFRMMVYELSSIIFSALIPGCAMGYFAGVLIISSVETEGFSMPLEISMATYMNAAIVTIFTAVISFYILYRKIRKMDMLSVLKVRE